MSENIFDATWLNTRFPFDETARNQEVDFSVFKYLKNCISSGKKELKFLDVGAGTGANFLHFFEKINSSQDWIFLDHDPKVLQTSISRIKAYAKSKEFSCKELEDGLLVQHQNKKVSIKVIAGSFEKMEQLIDLPPIDLIMASAFFDLFRKEQLHVFLDKVFFNKIALLLTLNYADMRFSPVEELDAKVTQWYADHMQRPKLEGPSMGPDCSSIIRSHLQSKGVALVEGISKWKIAGKDQKMSQFLLGFITSSMKDLKLAQSDQKHFTDWLELRKTQWQNQTFGIQVDHYDFFAKHS